MKNRYQKPQHEVFIKAMIEHNDPTKAYSIAYPNVSPASAQVAGSRLYGRPDIRARIKPALEQKYAAAHKDAIRKGEEAEMLRAEEVCRKRMFLAMVVRCDVRKRKAYKTKEGLLIVQEDPSHDTIIRAIELDLRLQDDYSRKDLIEKQFNRILRDLSPSPRHGILYTAEELMRSEPDVKLLSEPQIELIRLKNTDANEKTPVHEQQFITNSVACPPLPVPQVRKGGKGEGKTPPDRQHLITNSNCETPPPNPRQRGICECPLQKKEEKTPHHRQHLITNSVGNEKAVSIENQINQANQRFRQDEKTHDHRQLSITNSKEHTNTPDIENQANQSNRTNLRFRQEEKTPIHRQHFITNSEPSLSASVKSA